MFEIKGFVFWFKSNKKIEVKTWLNNIITKSKGTVIVIKSDSLCQFNNARFTRVPVTVLSRQV